MILIEKIKIETFNNRKLEHYKSLGYDITGDFIDVKIDHLNPGSRQLVPVECDFCKNTKQVNYREYLRNISIGGRYACSKDCGTIKAKESNILKWGVEHPMILKEFQDKVKETNLKKYGVEFLQQSEEIRKKTIITVKEKWGEEHISKTLYFKESFRKTCVENHGVEYPMMSEYIKNKSKNTCIENNGVDNPSKSVDIRNKVKETNLERYGNENYLLSDDYKVKSDETMKKKWNSDNIMKSEFFRYNRFSITKDKNYINYIGDGYSILNCKSGHTFSTHIDNYQKRNISNLPLCTVCNPIGDSQSIKEKNLYEFIKSIYHGEITRSYRDGLEIDIYLPELKLGFEFNGLYWHSEEWKNKWYHLNKTTYFKDKDITVIHIWEDDWTFKESIIKSQIRNWISLTKNRIYARSCEIMEVPTESAIIFLNKNHIQGKDKSMIKMGLYYNNELVSLMTFNKSEGRKKMENGGWNLSRFCNKIDTSVIGGSSKILIHFIKIHKPSRIVSYADRDWSTGDLYYKLGFNKVCERKPDYKYIINRIRVNKSRYRKSNLKTELSESKYMMSKSINRIWDCGKIKFEKILIDCPQSYGYHE